MHLQEFVGGQAAVLQLDMEDDQVCQEENCKEVQTTHNVKHDFELRRQVGPVKVLLDRLDTLCDLLRFRNIVDYEDVSHIVHQAEPEDPDNELEKVIIVLVTNTIIKVTAVVVEAGNATIALSTVLRPSQHM